MLGTTQQIIQETQYDLPYHYIPSITNGHFKHFIHWSWSINYMCFIEYIVERIKQEKFDKIIDVGCGDGRFIRELSGHNLKKTMMGVDTSSQAIQLAKALNPNLEFQNINILLENKLPNDFDIVTLVEVFEHLPIEQAPFFLSKLAGLQKSGGRLYLSVPHSNRKVQKKHFQHFSSKTLKEYLQKDYDIQEFIFFDKKKWYLKYLKGIMSNRFFILNYTPVLDLIYKFYKRNLFLCSESECSRLCAIAVRK